MAERGRYVHEAARFKADPAAVEDPRRIEQIVARVKELAAEQGLSPAVVEATYRAMVGAFTVYEQGIAEAARKSSGTQAK